VQWLPNGLTLFQVQEGRVIFGLLYQIF
jgi:hypothetical protein